MFPGDAELHVHINLTFESPRFTSHWHLSVILVSFFSVAFRLNKYSRLATFRSPWAAIWDQWPCQGRAGIRSCWRGRACVPSSLIGACPRYCQHFCLRFYRTSGLPRLLLSRKSYGMIRWSSYFMNGFNCHRYYSQTDLWRRWWRL
jgi:hypothetical protein